MSTYKPVTTQAAASGARFGGTLSLLGIAFVVLKLVGVIDWSWWYVTLPFYGPSAALLAIAAVLAVIGGLFLGAARLVNGKR